MKTQENVTSKQYADAIFEEYRETIKGYMASGISKVKAFHIVMDKSCLGAGYKAQMRKEFDLSIFD